MCRDLRGPDQQTRQIICANSVYFWWFFGLGSQPLTSNIVRFHERADFSRLDDSTNSGSE